LKIDAQECCEKITPFSFKYFENEFFHQRNMFETLQSTYESYISELKSNNQYGTAASYQTAFNAFSKFKPNLDFEDITKEFLQKFEIWFVGKGKSLTTVSIYVRTLRAIMNLAKDKGTQLYNYSIWKKKVYNSGNQKYKEGIEY